MSLLDAPKAPSRSLRRIGFGFLGLITIILFIAIYVALSKATIFVEPNEKELNADLLVSVREKDLRNGDILGRVGSVTVSREALYPTNGTGEEKPAKATGQVTIYNNNNKSQTLIATTRLLSKSGVLFRLQKTVTMAPGASVKASIIADKEGRGGEIDATIFTIPGLATSLQTKIYAKSTESTVGGVTRIGIVTEKDIDIATEDLKASLFDEATAQLKKDLNGNSQFTNVVFVSSIKITEVGAKVGAKAANFKIKMELEVIGVAYDAALQDQAERTISSMVPSDRKLLSSNILELQPSIEKYDLDDKSANLKVGLIGNTIISADSPVFDREKLAGMNADEVKNYLEKYAGVKNVDIKFFPFWLDRVPKLRDHVKVIVQ